MTFTIYSLYDISGHTIQTELRHYHGYMRSVARRWAKKEDVELDTLSEFIKSIGDVLKRRIRRLKHSVNTRHESIFSDPDVVTELSSLHENFVIVPADKASNNYTFVSKRYYVDILIEELGLHYILETLHTILQIFLHQRF